MSYFHTYMSPNSKYLLDVYSLDKGVLAPVASLKIHNAPNTAEDHL